MTQSTRLFGYHHPAAAQHRRAVDRADCGGVADLTLARASGDLKHSFGDVSHAVQSPLAQTAAKGIDRQLPLQGNTAVLGKSVGFALWTKAGGFEPVERGGAEPIVQFGSVHIPRSQP